mmetsp:Transcript_34643/g.40096  ORF Transcript_34643/g.40096 Transcript_34643/m.40096 type:complete len:141 (-) Transcript_34643:88-510(-)
MRSIKISSSYLHDKSNLDGILGDNENISNHFLPSSDNQISAIIEETKEHGLDTSEVFDISNNSSTCNILDNVDISMSENTSGFVSHMSIYNVKSPQRDDNIRITTESSAPSLNTEMDLFRMGFHQVDFLTDTLNDLKDES